MNRRRTKKKGKKPRRRRINDPSYFKALNSVIDRLFNEAHKQKLSWERMAGMSGLSRSTIEHLGLRITKYPEYRTIVLLAQSLGGRLSYVKGSTAPKIEVHWTPRIFRASREAVA